MTGPADGTPFVPIPPETAPEVMGASSLLKDGMPGPALALLEKRLATHPGDPVALAGAARCLLKLKRFEESVYRARLVPVGPKHAVALEVEMEALFALERFAEARVAGEEYVRLLPASGHGHQMLAWIALREGDSVRALPSAERAVELWPRSVACLLALATAQLRLENWKGARATVATILEVDPTNTHALTFQQQLASRGRRRRRLRKA